MRRPASVAEELTIFMTCSVVEAMLKKEKEKASSTSLDLKSPHSTKVAAKPYPANYIVPEFHKSDDRKGNTLEHVVSFLESICAHAHDAVLCLRKFSKSLIDRAYTWYVNLKARYDA